MKSEFQVTLNREGEIMSAYMNSEKFIEHYNGRDIYEDEGRFYVVKPADYNCCAVKETTGRSSIGNCREYIDCSNNLSIK